MKRRNFLRSLFLVGGFTPFPSIFSYFPSEEVNRENPPIPELNPLEKKIHNLYSEINEKFDLEKMDQALILDGSSQRIYLVSEADEFNIQASYPVSTSKRGFGNRYNGFKTPTGIHKVVGLYGKKARYGSIFQSRKNTGILAKISEDQHKTKGLMTSRLIVLKGCEEKNKSTLYRGIYIHGTSAEGSIGKPVSHGCIRMKNVDVIELFNSIKIGTYLNIWEGN